MPFSDDVVSRAWERQGGLCAYCGKKLARESRDKGSRGAWHAHHRKARVEEGTDYLHNCVLFCINEPENCHLNIGHDGDYDRNPIINDSELKYLYAGKEDECFIATAAYGSPLAEEVITLRQWKNNVLNNTIIGKALIKVYYFLSPFAARKIRNSEHAKKIIRYLINLILGAIR